MVYIKEIKYSKPLKHHNPIKFVLSDETIIEGYVQTDEEDTFIHINNGSNSRVFTELDIDSPLSFVSDIVGYNTIGAWPQVRSIKDLEKVLDALMKVNKPSDTTVKLKIKTNKSVKLNFKL